ncbi:hypothetical protein VKT23_014568 [Stygiomarasmius scandens]|uniref:F-box domain-containing protein n=1 Tax=Marasmiellus scandens TaxID=2682957 RepID=A0ABR1J0H1_9AGAR
MLLSDLPIDVIRQIALEFKSIPRNLWACNKYLRDALDPIVFRTISIDTCRTPIGVNGVHRLTQLANDGFRGAKYIKRLDIRSLKFLPSPKGRHGYMHLGMARGGMERLREMEELLCNLRLSWDGEEEIRRSLGTAIRNLVALESFQWIISEREIKAWIPDMLFQALSTLPQLKDVALDDEGRGLQLFPRYSMRGLSNLRRISIRGSYNSSIPNPVQGLSSVIRNSPNLEEVLINVVDNNPKEYAFERPRLHIRHLFEPQSSQQPLHNIRILVLSGVDMDVSESDSIDVLPHILGLETLNITEEYPVSQNLWVTLRSAQVQLRKIKFCGLPSRETIEYLDSESFSGLEELDVTYRGGHFGSADDVNRTTDFESSSDSGDMLVVLGSSNDRLYGRVLNRHAGTLRSLRLCISPTWDYDASLWEWDMDALAKCHSLEELALGIEDNHIQEDLVPRILSTALNSLINLRKLEFVEGSVSSLTYIQGALQNYSDIRFPGIDGIDGLEHYWQNLQIFVNSHRGSYTYAVRISVCDESDEWDSDFYVVSLIPVSGLEHDDENDFQSVGSNTLERSNVLPLDNPYASELSHSASNESKELDQSDYAGPSTSHISPPDM